MCSCIGDALLLLPLLASSHVSVARCIVCSYQPSAAVHHLFLQILTIDDSLTGDVLTLFGITLP